MKSTHWNRWSDSCGEDLPSVTTANEGEEGWRKFNELHPDLIITDLLMPGCSGIDLIRKIREAGYMNPIVITSALQDVDSIIKTVDLGISKYIIKPINMTELDADLKKLAPKLWPDKRNPLTFPLLRRRNEAAIRHIMSNILKKHSGKGPKDVKVLLSVPTGSR